MVELINYFKNDFLKDIGGLALLVTVLVYLSRLMAQQVFKKNMEDYKKGISKEMADYQKEITKETADHQKEISRDLENLKYQQQKNFKDFELFTSKKHEKYPEMYFHLETAYSYIFDLQQKIETGRSYPFEKLNEEDLNLYIDNDLKLMSSDKQRILEKWRDNKPAAIDEIRKIDKNAQYEIAFEKWTEASNYYICNQLYFTDVVSNACNVMRNNLHEYFKLLGTNDLRGTEMNELDSYASNLNQQMFKEDVLPNNRISVRTEMQKELRIGNT
ncbi:hypothetical protein [Peribacillus sp. V2I11]|uniref:hypothetical protein n=1 Tax=Peribacillus sp. V2I11 TaxID=3042277 RepID=UPI00278281D5|nr:hypothetical protein [Peribacillus sp. V2I11]MDQ0884841.1 hypothetical protein [Peribacillus sp. V2I11]